MERGSRRGLWGAGITLKKKKGEGIFTTLGRATIIAVLCTIISTVNLFIAVATLCTTSGNGYFFTNPCAHKVCPLCSQPLLLWSCALRSGILHFSIRRKFILETKEQADLRYAKQSSILGLFVLLNMVAPYCHRFCTVHRCEIGAVRMPRNCCHHSSERCNRSIRLLCFFVFIVRCIVVARFVDLHFAKNKFWERKKEKIGNSKFVGLQKRMTI